MGYHQKGLCKGYVLEWNIAQTCKNEGDPLKRRQILQLKFVDRFPFEQRTSRMDKNGVSWSYCRLVFTCFPLSSFCFLSCFHAFPVTVSVGFLSAFVSFCCSRLFFSYLVFPPAAFTFCQVSAFRLQVFFLSGGFVFPSGFAFWNEAKTKAKTKAKFTTSSLA